MKHRVYFSTLAVLKLKEIVKYLEGNWPPNVKQEFLEKLDQTKLLISKYPETFPISKSFPGLYKCTLTKHNTIFYRIHKNEIEIVTLFDSRQHPQKLKKEIRKK